MNGRKPRLAALLSALLFLSAFESPRWQFRSSASVPPGTEVAAVRITRGIYLRSQPGLSDLRAVRDGREIPYVLDARTGALEESALPLEILDREIVSGGGLRLVLDLGDAAKHSRLRLHTREKNFRERVRIESSEHNRGWAVIRDDAWIFNFEQNGRNVDLLTVDYPVSTRRYVRISIPGWRKPDAIAGVSSILHESHPAEREVIASIKPQVSEEPETKSTLLTLDLGVPGLPHDRIGFEVGRGFFNRAVEIETSRDGNQWRFLAAGAIYRIPGAASDGIEYPETHERYLRARIFNRDDQPLSVEQVRAETIIRYMRFIAEDAGLYWIYTGNGKAGKPSYDLSIILAHRRTEPVLVAAAAPQTNPVYSPLPAPPKPWTERRPALLYGILAAAVLGMGYVSVRFLRKIAASSPQS